MEDQVELTEQKASISWYKVGKSTSFNRKKKTSLEKKGAV